MSDISRRDFLKAALAGLGAVAAVRLLVACAPVQPAVTPPASKPVSSDSSIPVENGTKNTSYPDIAVVKMGEPEQLVRKAIDELGGMKRFVKKGDNVIIKPNIGPAIKSYEYAASTNPWVIGTLVKLCMEAGAGRVRIMDKPFGGTAESGFANSGIREQGEKAGGEIEIMSRFKYISTEIPLGRDIKKWDIYEDILKPDVLINVPIAKQHSSAGLTLGMKNLMGTINNPQQFHLKLHQRIADLHSRIKPTLTVVDAVRILVAHGPTGGDLNDVRKLDTIIAGTDIVAIDSYATSLFGLKPTDIGYIKNAAEMGLGIMDLSKLNVKELTLGS